MATCSQARTCFPAGNQIVPGEIINETQRQLSLRNAAHFKKIESVLRRVREAPRLRRRAANIEAIERDLETLEDAWSRFQSSRKRDAVYGYLTGIYTFVRKWRRKLGAKKLVRFTQAVSGLRVGNRSDLFATVLLCTADRNGLDYKTRSKWCRVLRYADKFKRRSSLRTFIRGRGGLNACATQYAKRLGRSARTCKNAVYK